MGKFMQEITGGYILSPHRSGECPDDTASPAIRFCQQEIHDKP